MQTKKVEAAQAQAEGEGSQAGEWTSGEGPPVLRENVTSWWNWSRLWGVSHFSGVLVKISNSVK